MTDLSSAYRALYQQHWAAFEAVYQSCDGLSSPLLIDPPDAYAEQAVKLMIVGQETNSWYNEIMAANAGAETIDALMHAYKTTFQMGLNYTKGTFWRFMRELEKRLSVSPGAIIWNNVNKTDQNNRRPSKTTRKLVRSAFPVLTSEIALAAPDVLVFFTGPFYDDYLTKTCFPDAILHPLEVKTVQRVEHAELPENTFRTYHPNFLQRSLHWQETLDCLVSSISSAEGE